ncbi:MAG: hypothetical protein M3Q23_16835 [Actinomycetota bacterium]|nr:hypothetical protein [Actinomycetota bacterium]
MITLTFRDERFDWGAVVREVGEFFDRLSYTLRRQGILRPEERLCYVWVLELHPGGHGLHVHALLDRSIPHALLSKGWGYGMVDVRRWRRYGSRRENARAAASYVTKQFVSDKDWLRERGIVVSDGAHRYGTAKGFLPRVVRMVHQALHQAWDWFMGLAHGEVPLHELSSADIADWRGPPWLWMQWL